MKKKAFRPLTLLLLQLVTLSVLSALFALTEFLGVLYEIGLWGIMPLLGLVSAYRVTRGGVNNYLSWLLPPACMLLVHVAVWTYLPNLAAVLVCAFLSVVGAAAGEVKNNDHREGVHRRWRRN